MADGKEKFNISGLWRKKNRASKVGRCGNIPAFRAETVGHAAAGHAEHINGLTAGKSGVLSHYGKEMTDNEH